MGGKQRCQTPTLHVLEKLRADISAECAAHVDTILRYLQQHGGLNR